MEQATASGPRHRWHGFRPLGRERHGFGDRKLWIVSELYYPETTSTGHIMTTIAEGLAAEFDTHVLCARPTYSQRGTSVPIREEHHGVKIQRVRSTTMDKRRVAGRLTNLASFTFMVTNVLIRHVRPGDMVLVVTNPPTLPYVASVIGKTRGAKTILIVHDLFPDSLTVGRSTLVRRSVGPLEWLSRSANRLFDAIVTIGEDQRERLDLKLGGKSNNNILVIPLASDFHPRDVPNREESKFLLETIPVRHHGKLLVQFAGNLGPLQGLGFLVDAIAQRRSDEAHFVIVGDGRERDSVRSKAEQLGLTNLTLASPLPRSETADLHAGSDIVVVSLVPGMRGISVPSRIGNALAAGRPILAITDEGSAIDRIIKEHDVGWSIRPGDFDAFWLVLANVVADRSLWRQKSQAARWLAIEQYSEADMIQAYVNLARRLIGDHS